MRERSWGGQLNSFGCLTSYSHGKSGESKKEGGNYLPSTEQTPGGVSVSILWTLAGTLWRGKTGFSCKNPALQPPRAVLLLTTCTSCSPNSLPSPDHTGWIPIPCKPCTACCPLSWFPWSSPGLSCCFLPLQVEIKLCPGSLDSSEAFRNLFSNPSFGTQHVTCLVTFLLVARDSAPFAFQP